MIRIQNRHGIIGKIGSFWQEELTPRSRQLMRSFVNLPNLTNMATSIEMTKRQLEGEKSADEGFRTVSFDQTSVAVIGPDLQQRILSRMKTGAVPVNILQWPKTEQLVWPGHAIMSIDSDSTYDYVAADNCQFLLWPDPTTTVVDINSSDLRPMFVIPLDRDLTPYSIQLPERNLVLGSDFFVGDGAMIFRENPYDLFPDGKIVIINSGRQLFNIMNYTLKADDFQGSAAPIAHYFRESCGLVSLQAAAAVAAGLAVAPADLVIQGRYDRCNGSRYVTDLGIIDALYRHDRLPVGASLRKGDVFGDGLRILPGQRYRELGWQGGLVLGNLSPVRNIIIPDRPCTAEAYAEGAAGKLHVRFLLGLDPAFEAPFWENIRQAELVTGRYLNDAVGLAALGDTAVLNPLDFYFDNLLSTEAVLAHLRLQSIGEQYRLRARSFLQSEKLVGAVLIIVDE